MATRRTWKEVKMGDLEARRADAARELAAQAREEAERQIRDEAEETWHEMGKEAQIDWIADEAIEKGRLAFIESYVESAMD